MYQSYGKLFIFLFFCVGLIGGSCTFRSAKWSKGIPKVGLTSSTITNKVLVDWSSLIVNKECADLYNIWIWRDGQEKEKGKKFLVSDKNTLTKIVDIEPCLNHNIAVELKNGKSTEVAKFNSATIPPINKDTFAKYLSVGYYKNPRDNVFDVSKATIKINRDSLPFLNCIKHIEVSGTSKKQDIVQKSSTSSTSVPKKTLDADWTPFGKGRQFGENGLGRTRAWHHLDDRKVSTLPDPPSPAQTTVRPGATTTKSSWGYKPAKGTPAPTSARGGWSYDTIALTDMNQDNLDLMTIADAAGPSSFTGKFLRMKDTGNEKKTAVVKESPPFRNPDVELVVPVEACQQYIFEVRIISPNNAVVGTIPDIILPKLPDIIDFVPPPVTEVVDVKFLMGGKHDVVAKKGSSIPESCLLDYFEALDAFANRVEIIANAQHIGNAAEKTIQDNVQDDVEKTQSEFLKKFGCICTSPRLEILNMETGSFDALGVYLYEGMHDGRPYYKQDLEERSLANKKKTQTSVVRRKRFIGRVDGGGQATSTTARNWMNPGSGSSGYNPGVSTLAPPWREYFGVTTHSPDTRYSNRYSDTGRASDTANSDNRDRTTHDGGLGSTLDCPSQNMNLNLRQNADNIGEVSSWRECARRCSEKGSCQYWVWGATSSRRGAKQCTLMDGFGSKRFDANTVAGRWDCDYYGSTGGGDPSRPSSPSSSGGRPASGGGSVSGRPPAHPGSPSRSRPGSVSPPSPSRGGSVSPPAWSSGTPVTPREPHVIFWDQKTKKWIVSTKLGVSCPGCAITMSSPTKCPADNTAESLTVSPGRGNRGRLVCSPDY